MFSLNIILSLVYDYSGRSGEAAVLLDQQTQFLRQVPFRVFLLAKVFCRVERSRTMKVFLSNCNLSWDSYCTLELRGFIMKTKS